MPEPARTADVDAPTPDQQVNAGGDVMAETAPKVKDPGGANTKGYSADPLDTGSEENLPIPLKPE